MRASSKVSTKRNNMNFVPSSSSSKLLNRKDPGMASYTPDSMRRQKDHSLYKQPSSSLGSLVTQVRPTSSMPDGRLKSDLIYKEHLFQTFQSLKFIRNLPPMEQSQVRNKTVHLKKRPGYENKKTLVFDLDETLVHCLADATKNADVVIRIPFPSGAVIPAGINIRPYVKECLVEANKRFEVIVFTASQRCYADVVLNHLDPTGELIHHRLYRDNCINVQGVFVKDLRILYGRHLKDIIIVDNATYSFGYQIDNGIPIISWHDDYNDKELYNLIDYLKILARVEDVRDVNGQTFHLKTFYEDYLNEFVRKKAHNN